MEEKREKYEEINKFPDNYITDETNTYTATDKLENTIDMKEHAEIRIRKLYDINIKIKTFKKSVLRTEDL